MTVLEFIAGLLVISIVLLIMSLLVKGLKVIKWGLILYGIYTFYTLSPIIITFVINRIF